MIKPYELYFITVLFFFKKKMIFITNIRNWIHLDCFIILIKKKMILNIIRKIVINKIYNNSAIKDFIFQYQDISVMTYWHTILIEIFLKPSYKSVIYLVTVLYFIVLDMKLQLVCFFYLPNLVIYIR